MSNNKIITSMGWRFAEKFGNKGVSFLVSIILARILTPDEYGTVSLVLVFITILEVFVNGGFVNSLIQKQNADQLDFSTVFYFQIFFCLLLYGLLYISAPYIATFYDSITLTNVIRVLGLKVVLSGLLSIQNAYVFKHMQFKKFFFSTLSGTILSAIIGITMGYMGYGVWALVTQTLTATIGSTVVLWFTVEFRPSLIFSFQRLQSLFSYGWKILFSTLLGTFYSSLRNLIIGKMYSTADLAYYNKGEQFPNLIIININSTIDNVLLPAMANVQNNLDNVKFMARKAIRTSSYMLWPCMVGLFVCAEPLVSIVLTDKWIEIVPYLRIFCIIYAFLPIQTTNTTTLKAIGKSDVLLKVEITKKIIGIISILLSMHYGVYCIALAALIVTPIEMFINIYPNKHFINYSFYEQLTDILPSILLSTAMGFSIWWLQYLALPNILILGLQISLGMFIYILLSFIFKVEQFKYVLSVAKTLINKFKFKIKKA